jgi:hypothetical protein
MAKTTCDWTVERLPWWATGTLEEGEGEGVREHLDDCDSCRQELAATRRALALHALHLPVETLLDLVEDGAAESFRTAEGEVLSRAAVDAHLGHCASCRQELSLLRESRAAVEVGPDEVGTVTAFAPRRATADAEPARGRRFDRRLMALAASVAIAVVAAGGWLDAGRTLERQEELLAEYGRRLEAAEAGEPAAVEPGGSDPAAATADPAAADPDAVAPAAQAAIARLEAEVVQLREEAAKPMRIASAGSVVAWDATVVRGGDDGEAAESDSFDADEGGTLVISSVPTEGPLRLVIEEWAGGRRVRTLPGLEPRFDNDFLGPYLSIDIPPGALAPGEYRVRVLSGDRQVLSKPLTMLR